MPWFKVDDGFHAHAKAVHAGTAALGLWVRCGSWSAQQVTGGKVPRHIALFYGTKTCIKALVDSGLWQEIEDGYLFHDWEEMNPSREQVLADRAAAKERQRKAREAARQRRESAGTPPVVTDMSQRDIPVSTADVQSPRPDPTRPEGSYEPSQEPGATVTPISLAESLRAKALLESHLQAVDRRPSRDTLRDLGRKIDQLIKEGFEDRDISEGLDLLRRNPRLGPGMLSRLVDQAIDSRPRRRSDVDRMFG